MASKKNKTKNKKGSLLSSLKRSRYNRRFVLQVLFAALLGGSAFFLAKNYRNLILVGTINNTPISRWQLTSLLLKRYGQVTLDEIINETLLKDLAKKESITVTSDEVVTEKQNLIDRLGGEEKLNATLQQYGLSKEELDKRLEISLIQKQISEKLFTVQVSDKEVKDYFDNNKYLYPDQKLKDIQAKIKDILSNQKLQQEFSKWFEQKKKEAKINRYI